MINFNRDILDDLVKNKITIEQVQFGKIKIGEPIEAIDIFEINDIYILNPSLNSYNFENSNYTIRERVEQLHKFDGYIHLAGGLSCCIKNQKVSDYRISKRYIEGITHYTREEIIMFNGNPDYELEDINPWGIDVDNYILVYINKKLNFYINPENNKLKEIYTAELDKSKFKMREFKGP